MGECSAEQTQTSQSLHKGRERLQVLKELAPFWKSRCEPIMRKLPTLLSLVFLAFTPGAHGVLAGAKLPEAPAAALGFDESRLRRIDGAVDRAIAGGIVPGAVVLVGGGERLPMCMSLVGERSNHALSR